MTDCYALSCRLLIVRLAVSHITSVIRRLAVLAALSYPTPLMAGEAPVAAYLEPAGFSACITRLQDKAREAGVSDAVVTSVLGQVAWVPRVIELDRRQPEFSQTFAGYYTLRVSDDRVSQGRKLLVRHHQLLSRIQAETGVPPHYLVAFWGLETNFGRYFGKMPIPDSLTTLACDERRSGFFTRELVAALKIIDAGHIDADKMLGSWAGAMGHVQFMPSVFRQYAVDADGDGKVDLWGSIPDALTSGGSFLQHLGWERGQRWGREVRLPAGFDYSLAGKRGKRSLRQWAALGITTTSGAALAGLDWPSTLIVPSGHKGPAFLTYPNFNVIMGWNRSEFYAVSVGRLADRIAGAGRLAKLPPADETRIAIADTRRLQEQLNELGFDAGEADGIIGPSTRAALSRFQLANGVIADGHVNQLMLTAVNDRAMLR